MKTSEFIRRVGEKGYCIELLNGAIHIEGSTYIYLNQTNRFKVSEVSDDLLDLIVEYAKTPIEERKEDKKYYLYNPVQEAYFNYYTKSKSYHWSNTTQLGGIQTQFTEEEIKDHKFRDIMELLVKEEVECQS